MMQAPEPRHGNNQGGPLHGAQFVPCKIGTRICKRRSDTLKLLESYRIVNIDGELVSGSSGERQCRLGGEQRGLIRRGLNHMDDLSCGCHCCGDGKRGGGVVLRDKRLS
jgi:hypothetical protein